MARPSIPLIDVASAVKAALDVVDEVGLEGFSLARVAKKLGVRAPSLYYHFQDKAELLEKVARLILLELPGMKSDHLPYEDRVVQLCLLTRRALLRHPNAAPLMLRFFPRNLLLKAYEEAATAAPYPPEFHMAAIEGAEKLTFGSALFAAAARARGIAPMPNVNARKHPMLAHALEKNPFDEEQLFAETIRGFLAGIAERARQANGQPATGDTKL